jgi:hypothetical protein
VTLYAATDDLSIVRVGGGIVVPGIVQSIELPERGINWQVQQGVSGLGASTIWRGVKLIESVKITTMLAKRGAPMVEWDEAVAAWAEFLKTIDPAPLKRKPPAWDIDHPLFRMLWPPLGRVAHKSNRPAPAHDRGLAWLGIIEFIEYRPLKLATPGPPDPAQIDSRDQPPADAYEANFLSLMNKAAQITP